MAWFEMEGIANGANISLIILINYNNQVLHQKKYDVLHLAVWCDEMGLGIIIVEVNCTDACCEPLFKKKTIKKKHQEFHQFLLTHRAYLESIRSMAACTSASSISHEGDGKRIWPAAEGLKRPLFLFSAATANSWGKGPIMWSMADKCSHSDKCTYRYCFFCVPFPVFFYLFFLLLLFLFFSQPKTA